jgi:hypothetical protein
MAPQSGSQVRMGSRGITCFSLHHKKVVKLRRLMSWHGSDSTITPVRLTGFLILATQLLAVRLRVDDRKATFHEMPTMVVVKQITAATSFISSLQTAAIPGLSDHDNVGCKDILPAQHALNSTTSLASYFDPSSANNPARADRKGQRPRDQCHRDEANLSRHSLQRAANTFG